MILGMDIVSSSTLSTFNKGFYNFQVVVVDKKLLKLTKGNDVEYLSSMSYIDNYIPQEKEEVEIEEENLIDENVSIFSLYSASNNHYTDNGHGDDKPTGATKIRFIIRVNYVNSTNNRGRMLVGNINYKYGI